MSKKAGGPVALAIDEAGSKVYLCPVMGNTKHESHWYVMIPTSVDKSCSGLGLLLFLLLYELPMAVDIALR